MNVYATFYDIYINFKKKKEEEEKTMYKTKSRISSFCTFKGRVSKPEINWLFNHVVFAFYFEYILKHCLDVCFFVWQ